MYNQFVCSRDGKYYGTLQVHISDHDNPSMAIIGSIKDDIAMVYTAGVSSTFGKQKLMDIIQAMFYHIPLTWDDELECNFIDFYKFRKSLNIVNNEGGENTIWHPSISEVFPIDLDGVLDTHHDCDRRSDDGLS